MESTEEFRNGSGDIVLLAKDAMKEVLEEARKLMDDDENPKYRDSGTCITIMFYSSKSNDIITASVGDCRAVLLQRQSSELFELTPDHSWSNPEEKKRALAMKCELRSQNVQNVGTVGRLSVWYGPEHELYTKDAQKPGLAMSRVLGFTSVKQQEL